MKRIPWNKGCRKKDHPSLLKMSDTIKARGLDNFSKWRAEMMAKGLIKSEYPPLEENSLTAELVGVVLGDGNVSSFPRCERLIISSHSENKYFIKRYSRLVEEIFKKKPSINKTDRKCIRISIYEKKISERLMIPVGARGGLSNLIPRWIFEKDEFIIACLKGLFEAEGSLNIHTPTYTYNFAFSNLNRDLLNFVHDSLVKLGFNPERRSNAIRLRRKLEVEKLEKLIKFRQ